MGGVRDAFLMLLRSGLWGRDPMEEGFLRLGDEEWEQVFKMSGRQTVSGIVFDGICRLPDEFQPSPAIFAKWVAATDRIERGNGRMNAVLRELTGMFVSGGLQPVLQKGQGVAALYPTPAHRECGDIDFYFPENRSLRLAQRPENAAQRPIAELVEAPEKTENGWLANIPKGRNMNGNAIELVKSHGIKVETMPDGSQTYEWKGIEIEQHPTIVDLSSPAARKWIPELDGDPGYVPSELAEGLRVPSPELNALLLNSHILKHTLGKGIGLRQMCDLAMEYHRICEDGRRENCGERIFSLYKRAGILKWSRLLHSFLVGVIGLPEEELPYSEKIVSYRPLFRIVEDGGNFGQYRGEDSDSHVRTGTVKRKLRTAGMFFRRAGFSIRFAPKEAFWTFWELAKGQFRR